MPTSFFSPWRSSLQKLGSRIPQPSICLRLCCFFWVLKGIHHYLFLFFPWGLNQMEATFGLADERIESHERHLGYSERCYLQGCCGHSQVFAGLVGDGTHLRNAWLGKAGTSGTSWFPFVLPFNINPKIWNPEKKRGVVPGDLFISDSEAEAKRTHFPESQTNPTDRAWHSSPWRCCGSMPERSICSPTAESFGVSAQVGSGVVRGGPEARFHEGSTKVPPGFHQGSTRVQQGFCEGSTRVQRGFCEGSAKFCKGCGVAGWRGGASTKKSTACYCGCHLSLFCSLPPTWIWLYRWLWLKNMETKMAPW